jgi:hypothetical protein
MRDEMLRERQRDEVREVMWPTVRPYLHVRPFNGFQIKLLDSRVVYTSWTTINLEKFRHPALLDNV